MSLRPTIIHPQTFSHYLGQVAATIAATTTVSMATAFSGSIATALTSVRASTVVSAGAHALNLLTAVQFFSLTSGSSTNMSDTYRALGCALAVRLTALESHS